MFFKKTKLKESMIEEVIEGMMTVSHQRKNISSKIDIIKKNQKKKCNYWHEKNLLEELNSRF